MLVSRYISIFERLYDCKVTSDGGRQSYVYVVPNEDISIEVWFNEKNVTYEITRLYDCKAKKGIVSYKQMASETISSIISIILKHKEEYEKSHDL